MLRDWVNVIIQFRDGVNDDYQLQTSKIILLNSTYKSNGLVNRSGT